jgi:hypothetical protein
LFDAHLEVEPQGVARLERRLQGVDAVAEIVVREDGRGGSVKGDRSGLDAGDGCDVDGVDRHGTAVE